MLSQLNDMMSSSGAISFEVPGKNAPDAAYFVVRYDASLIASEYELDFPVNAEDPTSENIHLARSISASVKPEEMAEACR